MKKVFRNITFIMLTLASINVLTAKTYQCQWEHGDEICGEDIKEARRKDKRGGSNALGKHIYEKHVRSQHHGKKIPCRWVDENGEVCGYKAKNKRDLRFHICEHTEEEVCFCVYCRKSFLWSHNLLRHQVSGACRYLRGDDRKCDESTSEANEESLQLAVENDELETLFRETEKILFYDSLELQKMENGFLRYLRNIE